MLLIDAAMPKCCGECPCSGTDVCREWMKVDKKKLGNKRADSCPIKGEIQDEIYLLDKKERY